MIELPLSLIDYALLVAVGVFASILNAMAGGGAFFMFPALVFVGLPPQLANVTNKVGMWTGALASVFGYRKEIAQFRKQMRPMLVCGVMGSIVGSLLLLVTPPERFEAMVPFLMAGATLIFAFGKQLSRWLRAQMRLESTREIASLQGALPLIGQAVIGIYAGFFGAGMGIIMMALYQLIGIANIHLMNGLKVSMATAMLGISTLTFILLTPIHWPSAAAIILGTLMGGYFGPAIAKRLPTEFIRAVIIIYGVSVSGYFLMSV